MLALLATVPTGHESQEPEQVERDAWTRAGNRLGRGGALAGAVGAMLGVYPTLSRKRQKPPRTPEQLHVDMRRAKQALEAARTEGARRKALRRVEAIAMAMEGQ